MDPNQLMAQLMREQEQKRRQQFQNAPASMAGTTGPYAVPPELLQQAGQDFTGREREIARMHEYANQMTGRGAPQGKTVGSGIYVEPNWGENLAYGINQAIGGYNRSKANALNQALDKDRSGRATAVAEIDNIRNEQANAQKDRDYALKAYRQQQADATQAWREKTDARDFEYEEGRDAVADDQWMAEFMQDQIKAGVIDGKDVSYNQPERFIDPYTGAERILAFGKNGTYRDMSTGKTIEPESLKGLIREKEMTESQREAAVASFIKNNKDLFALMRDVESAEQTWADGGMEPGGNPFNYLTKQAGLLGNLARAFADIGEDGAPTQNAYAAAQTVFNAITRMRAGLSQTAAELENIKRELGTESVLTDPEVVMKYWGRLRGKLQEDIALANRMASPRTVQAYRRWQTQKEEEQLPAIGAEPQLQRGGTGRGQMGRNSREKDEEEDLVNKWLNN